MLPSAFCWPTIHLAADCAAANCGIWGGDGVAAPAGAANEVMVAALSRRCQADSGNTHQGATDDVHGSRFPGPRPGKLRTSGVAPSPGPCVSTVGTLLTLRYPGSWCRLGGAPFTVADQRRILTGFPSRAVQLQLLLACVRYHGGPPGPPLLECYAARGARLTAAALSAPAGWRHTRPRAASAPGASPDGPGPHRWDSGTVVG